MPMRQAIIRAMVSMALVSCAKEQAKQAPGAESEIQKLLARNSALEERNRQLEKKLEERIREVLIGSKTYYLPEQLKNPERTLIWLEDAQFALYAYIEAHSDKHCSKQFVEKYYEYWRAHPVPDGIDWTHDW